MISDLEAIVSLDQYDVCIIGSGPAGATVANELHVSGIRCCVLESGIKGRSDFADSLKEVETKGLEIKEYSRERCIGGTSTSWAGLSSPLDPIDFQQRPWMEFSGWPISHCDLKEWYASACRYRFPDESQFSVDSWKHLIEQGTVQPSWTFLEPKVFLAANDPQNYAREFNSYFSSEQTDLIFNATVKRLDGDSQSGEAICAVVQSKNGTERRIKAKTFVLAANGIENARLLLLTDYMGKAGLGNQHDNVGRFLMNHPKNYFGTVEFSEPVKSLPAYFGFLKNETAGYLGLRIPPDEQSRLEVVNSYVRFEPLFPWTDNQGIESLLYFIKRSRSLKDMFSRVNRDRVVELRDYAETGDDSSILNDAKSPTDLLRMIGLIAINPLQVASYLFHRAFANKRPKIWKARVRNFMEMEPRPENRVRLSTKLDAFGSPLPHVTCNPTLIDRRSMAAVHHALSRDLESQGCGTLTSPLTTEFKPWPIDADASHHLGTTRMGFDCKTSVVDPNCRVWGTENVYVSGGSVFPTSGCVNPTYTVVALAIRLASHLREQFAMTQNP